MGGLGCRNLTWVLCGRGLARVAQGGGQGWVTVPWLPCTCHIPAFSCSSTS